MYMVFNMNRISIYIYIVYITTSRKIYALSWWIGI